MKSILLTLILVTLPCLAQTPPTSSGKAETKGTCSPAVTGNKNTFVITCGIGQQQGDKIIALLNTVLANRDMASINGKLDELLALASKPTAVQYCNGDSKCVQNGNQTNIDQRSYGVPKPLPNVVDLHFATMAAIPRPQIPVVTADMSAEERQRQMSAYKSQMMMGRPNGESGPTWNPGLSVSFRVDAPFQNPMFEIHCDHPCVGSSLMFYSNGSGGFSGSYPFLETNDPRVLVVQSGSLTFLTPGVSVNISLRSRDNDPITSATATAYAQ
jgi:hypothetical protein